MDYLPLPICKHTIDAEVGCELLDDAVGEKEELNARKDDENIGEHECAPVGTAQCVDDSHECDQDRYDEDAVRELRGLLTHAVHDEARGDVCEDETERHQHDVRVVCKKISKEIKNHCVGARGSHAVR